MRRRVRFAETFRADVASQVEWLSGRFPETYIDSLQTAIHEAARLLAGFPAAGPVVAKQQASALRKLILRRQPYVVWYAADDGDGGRDGDVWLLRLFHCRQDRPRPRTKAKRPKSSSPRRRPGGDPAAGT